MTAISPHDGPVKEWQALSDRFTPLLSTSENYYRRVVSYQGNRQAPGLRWMKYKEGFSCELVADLIQQERPSAVLDPFAGICTMPLVATGQGIQATRIEIMPVGVLVGTAIVEAANGLDQCDFDKQSAALLREVKGRSAPPRFAFPYVRIAEGAGFRCGHVWKLPQGKRNSSQQMARFGHRELRKCVYRWVRTND